MTHRLAIIHSTQTDSQTDRRRRRQTQHCSISATKNLLIYLPVRYVSLFILFSLCLRVIMSTNMWKVMQYGVDRR